MGSLGAVIRAGCAVAFVAAAGSAHADVATLEGPGVFGDPGYLNVEPDDFGCWGRLISQSQDDDFTPKGTPLEFGPTYLTGSIMFLTTPGDVKSRVLLASTRFWFDFIENPPPTPDGIAGMHTQLTRTVTTAITSTSMTEATSAFRIADPPSGLLLDIALVQRLSVDTAASTGTVDQVYSITNNGTVAVDIVFHTAWDPDLYWSDTDELNDIVGTGTGLCGVYVHDPGNTDYAIALGNGPMSTVPLASYYGGKEGTVPGSGPAFENIRGTTQPIWNSHGMPVAWRNFVVGPGYNAAGESDASLIQDATIGIEWRFSIAAGATERVNVRRYFGTTAIECFGGSAGSCGNGMMDMGELCDGADTPTCNGATCTMSTCGDGYPNAAAGEACDDGGDSAMCTVSCTISSCGDTYINAAAGEECEGETELCDPTTCTLAFSVGGGCAGCGASGEPSPLWLAFGTLVALTWRRRRRA